MVRIFDKLINDRARSGGTKFMWSDTKWSKGWHFTDQMDAHEFMGFLLDQLHDPRMPKYYNDGLEKVTIR
jgi:ubiquitin C-terminal hydrolase